VTAADKALYEAKRAGCDCIIKLLKNQHLKPNKSIAPRINKIINLNLSGVQNDRKKE
jgi:hypothetical protein